MDNKVYVKFNQNIEVSKRDILLGDVCDIFCKNQKLYRQVAQTKLVTIPNGKKKRICISLIAVMQKLQETCPQAEVENIGETDFIIDYMQECGNKKWLEWLLTAFVGLFSFIGSIYAIMAYNNDVGATDIFAQLYQMFAVEAYASWHIIEIAYAVGLFVGVVVFYNHFVGKRFTTDPTPIQVEMDKYEGDIDRALIDREGKMKNKKQ